MIRPSHSSLSFMKGLRKTSFLGQRPRPLLLRPFLLEKKGAQVKTSSAVRRIGILRKNGSTTWGPEACSQRAVRAAASS